jgi:hypothetical protein
VCVVTVPFDLPLVALPHEFDFPRPAQGIGYPHTTYAGVTLPLLSIG